MAVVKRLSVHRNDVVIFFTFSGPLGLLCLDIRKQNTTKAGAWDVRNVAFSSISHEQTQSNRDCCFPTSHPLFVIVKTLLMCRVAARIVIFTFSGEYWVQAIPRC